MIYNLYKQRGETPLECIQRFVAANPELKTDPNDPSKQNKFTYLGRLDPMAEGVLLVGSGGDTEQERREEFFGLDKEYDFVSVFGFATDTYDILGRIVRVEKLDELDEFEVRKVAMVYEGEREQKYPEYSSKMIAKKITHPPAPSLTLREGGSETKKITIHKLQFHKLDKLNNKELFGRLLMDISKVKGDFRQNQILNLWKEVLLGKTGGASYFIGQFSAHVSSGTYIRGLVNDIGNTLGCAATTLSIKRTRVGDYRVEDSKR